MTFDDVDVATDVLVGGGWGNRRAFFKFAVEHARCWPLVAEVDDGIVGTGIATANGPVGWVGMIFVDEGLRGRGIGTILTQAVIERLETEGCATLALLASPLGRPIYERLGFRPDMDYRLLVAPGGPSAGSAASGEPPAPDGEPSRIRPFAAEDLAAIVAIDRLATGEDRAHLLRAVATPTTTTVIVRADGAVVGFDARAPWGGHPTIAPELVDGLRLVEARRTRAVAGTDVRTALPEIQRVGATTLENFGWREERRLTRMIRGAPVVWRPTAIWGQFNFAIG